MKLPALLISDLHLTANPKHEYRWGLFPWLVKTLRAERVKTLCVLGDVTDAKDNHSADLTNRVVRAFEALTKEFPDLRVHILSGNHDWQLAGQEFFRFLDVLPRVSFYTRPTEDDDTSGNLAYFLPYSKKPTSEWSDLDLSHYDYVFMHQTIKGAVASNGQVMEGESLPDLSAPGKVYSGDIHVPQVIGPVEYVGSPYHVHFGDDFIPRAVLIEKNGATVDLHFKTISRVTITAPLPKLGQAMEKYAKGDHVKLRVTLDEEDKHAWREIKREILARGEALGLEVHAVEMNLGKAQQALGRVRTSAQSDEEVILGFVNREGLCAAAFESAMEILDGPQVQGR